jgi:ferritin heavy chain
MSQQSQLRQNFSSQVEAAINKQINIELYASYVYLSMVSILSPLISISFHFSPTILTATTLPSTTLPSG